MNIKGKAAGSVGFWSGHLLREKENDPDPNVNDRVRVIEISGVLATDIEGALREMEAVASGSRSHGNFMYQANLNPQVSERLTPEQYREAVDILADELGMKGHQRVIVEHEKKGRQHGHVIFNRVDVDTMLVRDIGGNFAAHERAALRIEERFGLERTPKPHLDLEAYREKRDRPKPLDLSELRAAQKTGIDPEQIKAELTDVWRKADSGKALAAALEERGYILAQGDRRDFCIVDHAGTAHSLARRIDGAKAKDVKERLADIDRDRLPTVGAAREQQREKYPSPKLAFEAWRSRAGAADHAPQQEQAKQPDAPLPEKVRQQKPNQNPLNDIRQTWQQSPNSAAFAAAMRDQGFRLAKVTPDEARQSERDAASAKEVGNYAPRYQAGEIVAVNERGRVQRLDEKTTGGSREAVGRFNVEMQSADLPSIADAKQAAHAEREQQKASWKETRWHDRDETKMERNINRIQADAEKKGLPLDGELYAEGLTLARADATGIKQMEVEYNRRYQNDILAGKEDPTLRPVPFKAGELLAVDKWGEAHRLNPRRVDVDRLERAATGGSEQTPTLSAAREFFATDRQQKKDDRAAASETLRESRQTERTQDRVAGAFKRAPGEAVKAGLGAGLKVATAGGAAVSLGSFLEKLLGMGAKPPPRDGNEAIRQQRVALAALEDIAECIERGDPLKPSDVANLTQTHLENLKLRGDEYMRDIIKGIERGRDRDARGDDYGRTRGR